MPFARRQFVTALVVSGAAAATPTGIKADPSASRPQASSQASLPNPQNATVDFRYAPHHQQSTICFPDDPRKTIVGQAGDLRYGFGKSLSAGMENFSTVIEFSLAGFQDDKVLRQWIESPSIPIVHTLIDRQRRVKRNLSRLRRTRTGLSQHCRNHPGTQNQKPAPRTSEHSRLLLGDKNRLKIRTLRLSQAHAYQSHNVPSSLRNTGRYAR